MKQRVLLVDDEPAILAALGRVLRKAGFDVIGATCSSEAIRLMQATPASVVISDYRMPCINGTELLGRIEARWPDTVRIILSGYADYDTVMSAIESGVVHKFLAKPWNNSELIEQVSQAFIPPENSSRDAKTSVSNYAAASVIATSRTNTETPESVQLKVMLDTVADGIATLSSDGGLLSANKSMLSIFGYEPVEILGSHLAMLIPKQPDPATCIASKVLRDVTEVPQNIIGLRKNGEVFPMELTVTEMPVDEGKQYLAVIRDTSRRVEAERQNQLLIKSLENCQDGYALFGPGDRLVYCNQQFRRLYKDCEIGPIKGVTYGDFYHDCLRSGLFTEASDNTNQWLNQLLTDHAELPMEKIVELSPGRWIQIREDRIENGSLIAFHTDISELKTAEQSLKQAVADAKDASEAKSRFLAMMSHEIRTPLNGVLGLLQMLQESELASQQRDYVDTALVSGQSLLTIISDILDFSKMEAGKMELHPITCNLRSLVSELDKLLGPRVQEKSIRLITQVAVGVPEYVTVDLQRLRQVLLNLLGNAIKFTDYGQVILTIDKTNDDLISFAVKDTGIGIPENQQHRVFSEFSSGLTKIEHQVTEGTGLGLAISRHLITLMGGELRFKSQPGEGSHFWFGLQLDVATPPADNRTTRGSVDLAYAGSVLLVDDSATNRLVAKSMLESVGMTVMCAEDGYHALDICSDQQFDLVLMDISMPGIDGLETAAQLMQMPNWNQVPIIALTAYAMPGDRERFLALGMSDYVEKPLDKLRLLQVVGHYLLTSSKSVPEDNETSNLRPSNFIDMAKLKQLANDTSAELIPELAQVFIDDSKLRLIELDEATDNFAKADKQEVERNLHTLGSSAALYGLTEFSGAARRLERHCREGDFDQVETNLPAFLELGYNSRNALKEAVSDWSADSVNY